MSRGMVASRVVAALAGAATLLIFGIGAAPLLGTQAQAQPGRCLGSIHSYVECPGRRPNGLGSRCCWAWGQGNGCPNMLKYQYPTSYWGAPHCYKKSFIKYP